jgi:exodeoxyribonuclease VII large subunit
LSDVIDELDGIEESLNVTLRSRLDAYRERLDAWEQSWAMRHPADRLNINRQRFDELNARFLLSAGRILSVARRDVQSADDRLGRLIRARLKNSASQLDQVAVRLNATPRVALRNALIKWSSISDRLNALSPLAVLERGYSITTDAGTGRVLKSVAEARNASRLMTKLADGSVESEVTG